MSMNEIIINEKSLQGQFSSMDEFLDSLPQFLGCIKYFFTNDEWSVLKKSDLYGAPVTENEVFCDIRGNSSDAARKIKGLLCQMSDEPPFWDESPKQEGCYMEKQKDVTGTSLAEAAARTGLVVSFPCSSYVDKEVQLLHDGKMEMIASLTSSKYRADCLYKRGMIDIYTYLKEHFRGSRLCFDEFDSIYGFANFEKCEIEECLESFERFAQHDTWAAVMQDMTLRYKEYKPSKKENWFKNSRYEGMTIHKFRCVNPKRCFGYRKGDVFFALRMERDHSISDKG